MRFAADLPPEPVRVSLDAMRIERVHVLVGRALAQLARRRDDAIEAGRHEVLTEVGGGLEFTIEV